MSLTPTAEHAARASAGTKVAPPRYAREQLDRWADEGGAIVAPPPHHPHAPPRKQRTC